MKRCHSTVFSRPTTRLLPALILSAALSAPAANLEAGIAATDITPPVPYRMSGYFRERLSTGVHDPLYAKAIALKQGDQAAVLVFCDLIGIAPEVSRNARQRAAEKTGIPATNILIAATHSHTGPLYFGALHKYFHDRAIQEHGSDPHETVDYTEFVSQQLADVIAAACAAARPIDLGAAVATQTGLSFNRRFHMKGGGPVRFNPGKLNPKILRPAGPIDPQLGVFLARSHDTQEPLFSLSVFSLHLDTVGGTEYAADFPYYLGQVLQGQFGDAFTSVFAQGTCGDINHVDVSHKRPQKGHEEAHRIGTALGETVVAAMRGLKPIAEPALAVRSTLVDVPLRPCPPEDITRAQEDIAQVADSKIPFLERVATARVMGQALRGGTTLPMEVQVFRLNADAALVALPGEIFVDLGLAIKQASPFPITLVLELANDAPGYVPTAKAFEEGSYETVNSIIQSGGGEMLVDTALALLRELAA